MPVAYWSHLLCDAEIRYYTTEKVFLAVVRAVMLLLPYLGRSHFTIRADRQARRWILDLMESTGRFARWGLQLIELKFEIVHHPRLYHSAADANSRLPKVFRGLVAEAEDGDEYILTYCILCMSQTRYARSNKTGR